MKNHEIHLICSIPRSQCRNKYYEFISCLCMAEQNNELLIENHETCPNWFCYIPRSEYNKIWFIFWWLLLVSIEACMKNGGSMDGVGVGIAQRNVWACRQNQEGVNWFLNNKINTLKFFKNLSSRSINNFFITQ